MRRERQYTIDELADRLALPRSTIYYWVRDMPIAGSGSGGGWPRSAHLAAARANKTKHKIVRDAAYEAGRTDFLELQLEPGFRDFVCLYIAEGYKRDRNQVALCNSDAAVVAVADRFIRRFARNPVRYSIQHHADQDIGKLRAFWAEQLNIGDTRIAFQRKSNSGQLAGRTWRSVHGVLTVRACDTMFRARLQAWMDLVRASWS
ncbi:MAG: helix-turn-helix domain-containing protein [Thermoleophilaceae bacterium]